MEEERLQVGALFRRFNVRPTFTLHAAGRIEDGFWRQYQLSAPGLTCEINETFSAGCFDAIAQASPGAQPQQAASYGGV